MVCVTTPHTPIILLSFPPLSWTDWTDMNGVVGSPALLRKRREAPPREECGTRPAAQ